MTCITAKVGRGIYDPLTNPGAVPDQVESLRFGDDKGITMRLITSLIISLVLFVHAFPVMGETIPELHRDATIGLRMDRAIADGLITGGVVVIGNRDGILSTTSRGSLDFSGTLPITEDTIFDVASLTKVVATTPAVMKLVDKKLVSLNDPIARWFPEFRNSRYNNITIINLLTHTSGLADFNVVPGQNMKTMIRRAAKQKKSLKPGTSFNYADINFILLGELVHRVSKKPLDKFCRDALFKPLGATRTMFAPPQEVAGTIAPTIGSVNGVVQDNNARLLGGVTGHAGLFSSAADLSKIARMLLNKGTVDGKKILSQRLMEQMTTPYYCSSKSIIRAPGWDMESPFSAPKGSFFSETSYGHTGYSGSSIWIDPGNDLFVVVLTTRLDYNNTRVFNQLRRDISTFAAAVFGTTGLIHTEFALAPRDLPTPPRVARSTKSSKSSVKQLAAVSKKKKPGKQSATKQKKGKKQAQKQYSRPKPISPLPALSKSGNTPTTGSSL